MIVLEGLEESSEFSLSQAYKIGVEYVQGYITGRPAESIYDLDSEQKTNLIGALED